MVKRITAINGTDITNYVDGTDSSTSDDDDAKWPTPLTQYLRGAINCTPAAPCNGGTITGAKPGDTVEYTIYFLSNGTQGIKNVQLCDLIPTNTTFEPDTYATGKGVLLGWDTQVSPTTVPDPANSNELTNIKKWLTNADASGDDQGQFIAQPTALPSGPCGTTTNANGGILVNLGATTVVPHATSSATPKNSYGFFRFKVKVN
jgi:uncharacterized repeat protein (TIGR01451 family)